MLLRTWRFLTLLLAALSLTMGSAHVLEMPQKMKYDAPMYSAVNTTLYKYFAVIGGPYTVGAILAALLLAVFVRKRRPAFQWTLAGAIFLLLGFAAWLARVAPVNSRVAAALESAPTTVPDLWMRLRERWEYGQPPLLRSRSSVSPCC